MRDRILNVFKIIYFEKIIYIRDAKTRACESFFNPFVYTNHPNELIHKNESDFRMLRERKELQINWFIIESITFFFRCIWEKTV